MKTLHTIYNNFAKRMFTTLMVMMTVGITSALGVEYNELFTITSANVINASGQGSSYTDYSATINDVEWLITHGGTGSSGAALGTNSTSRANCHLSNYPQYAVAPITVEDLATVFVNTTPINDVSKISYTCDYTDESKTTNVYLIYSSDGNNFIQMPLSTDNQGADIANEMIYTFAECSGCFGLLFKGKTNSGDWRILNVSITYYGYNGTPPTYPVTWEVNGDVYHTADVVENNRVTMPEIPTDDCGDKTFVGWTTSDISEEGDAPLILVGSPEQYPAITEETTFYAVFADLDDTNSGEITDNITVGLTGVTSSAGYIEWTGKQSNSNAVNSNAVYAGRSNNVKDQNSNDCIVIRDNGSSHNTGIVTSKSGGKAKQIIVEWGDFYASNDRKLQVYGKRTPYESVADIHVPNKQGALIGLIDYNSGETTLDISGDYEYIGLSSFDGALYINKVTIVWESEGDYSGYTTSCTPKYTITLNPKGGDGGDYTGWTEDNGNYTLRTKENTSVELPTPTKKGYYFNGWYLDGTPVSSPYTVTTDVTLTAIWSQLNQFRTSCSYTLTWNLNGGIVIEAGTHAEVDATDICSGDVEFGAPITAPVVEQYAYKFLGWSEDGTNVITPATTMPSRDLTYIAVWQEKKLTNYRTLCENTVTWQVNGGVWNDGTTADIVETYAKGAEITPPNDPTRDGYKFVGWSPEFVEGTTMQDNDLIYVAQWSQAFYVTYDANDGSTDCEDYSMYAAGDEVTVCATTPTKIGHAFAGWQRNDDSSIVQANGTFTMPASNVTLIAQWTPNQHTVTWNPGEGGHWDGVFGSKVETYNYGYPINVPEDPEKSGYVFAKWEPDVTATMPDEDLEYTAVWYNDFCDSYTFHTGNADVWKSPQEQICFTHKEGTEWQITNYVIPTSDAQSHFLVAYRGWPQIDQGSLGGHSKSATSTWSATMYIAPTMDFSSADNSPKLGHAKGAIGTLRIFDDSSWDNLCVGFIPKGYGITLTSNSSGAKTAYAFNTTTTDHKLETNVVTLPGVTNNKYTVGLATQVEGEYVSCDHSNAAELINKMGVTEMVAGKRMVYLKPNDDWKSDGARFAAYFFNDNGNTWINMTDPDGDGIYGCEIPDGYSNVIFCRMNGGTTTNDWSSNNKWNQTQDIALPSSDGLAKLYTITDWNSCSGPTNLSPKTGQNGKFRMWDDSRSKNWYVHFIPYYLLTYNANGGEGEMAPTEYNTEDANNKVTVAANEFTRTGYDFVKWNTQADGEGTDYNSGDEYTMTSDATIYAQWKVQEYTINYKDQGNADYSGTNLDDLPTTHTYGIATPIPDGEKMGYTFEGWYDTPECDGTPITELVANDYIADITLYAKWTFAMEYDITNAEPVFITSAVGQTIKATTPLTLAVSNMPVGTEINISAPHIKFYFDGEEVTKLTNESESENFELIAAYTPENKNTTEQPTITLDVLDHEKVIDDKISCRSLPATFAIVAKVGNLWYALPSQGLNSTDDLFGYPIEVNDQDDPTTVTSVPANADWSLCQVYKSSGGLDRFTAYGHNLVFVNNEATPKALNASKTTNDLLTDAQYDGYQGAQIPGMYEWTPATTDLETYTLTNANPESGRNIMLSMNITNIFGVHKQNVATSELRFLPIQEPRYTQAVLQVVEWKENSVVVMYTGDPTQTATLAINGTEQIGTTTLNTVQKDIAIYELPASGIANKATQRLCIAIGGSKKWLTVPYIISSNTSDVDLLSTTSTTKALAALTDVVILDGNTFTAAGAKNNKYSFRNVTVYGGGKLVIPATASEGLGIYSLIMRIGTVNSDGSYTNSYPQLVMNGKYTNTSGISLDYITTYERYYALSVPYVVKTKDIKYPAEIYGDNLKTGNKASFALQEYDGAKRATGATGWKDFDESGDAPQLTPYKGYTFWGAPRKVSVNGGEAQRPKYGIHRIPLTGVGADDLYNSENAASKQIDITAYPAERPNDMGWNFLGNPYLAQYGGWNATADEDIQVGLLEKEMVDEKWTGGYTHEGDLRYVTFTDDGQNYWSEEVNKATFHPFNTFFIQAFATGKLEFTLSGRAQNAPARRYAAQQEAAKEITTGILLTGNNQTDRTGLLIADNFTEEYDFNADLSKFTNQGINLYTIGKDGNLAFMAINQALAEQPIPLGYGAPADGEYTFAFDDERYEANDISALYLFDYDRNETTNLLHTDYSFTTAAGTYNQRFALQVAFIPENATNIELTEDATIQVAIEGNNLWLNNLPTDATITIYDAVGHTITHTSATQNEMQFTLPTGYYLIRIANKQEAVVIDTVIP